MKQVHLIPCACQCGAVIPDMDIQNRDRRYINGHQNRNRKHSLEYSERCSFIHKGKKASEETRQRMSLSHQGPKHHNWRGSNVGYYALHNWVDRHLPEPQKCNMCGKKASRLEATNISNHYLRDLSDWEYLCVSCHRYSDGRAFTLTSFWELAHLVQEI